VTLPLDVRAAAAIASTKFKIIWDGKKSIKKIQYIY
jgi:hypothetical protein